ncbi:DNA-processing protein DprA [Virgibacillus oceani]|nr:DNA-processing protein DprA [Virgibacillus oceani]
MLQFDPTLKNLHNLSSSQLSRRFSIPLNKAQQLYADLHNQQFYDKIKQDLAKYTVITIVDENYPPMLKTIKDPPLVLYALGDTCLLHQNPVLSVIGTRSPTKHAFAKMDQILRTLIQDNWIIASGMAKGIDSYAHQLALRYSGKTIAVLGSGFHHVYPRQNTSLFQQIASKGLILSEYTPSTPPERFHFPERNRIISGLSFGTLVIEATERSGTLITVDQALDQGREVYAVPDSPLFPQTKGCHRMIQDGAKLVHDTNDIAEDWESIKQFYGKS